MATSELIVEILVIGAMALAWVSGGMALFLSSETLGKARIVLRALDSLDLLQMAVIRLAANRSQIVFAKVHCINLPPRADAGREPEGEIAAPTADVGHDAARMDTEGVHHALGMLPGIALRTAVLGKRCGRAREQPERDERQ